MRIVGGTFLNLNLLDLVLVGFLVVFSVVGFRKGLVKSVLSFLSLLVVAAFVPNISSAFSERIYNSFLENKVSGVTNEILNSNSLSSFNSGTNKVINKLDFLSSSILKHSGACSLENFTGNSKSRDAINGAIKEKALSYMNFLLTLLLFGVFLLLFKILLRRFSLRHLPVIGGMDAALGGVLGAVEFLVFAYTLLNLFNLFLPFVNEESRSFKILNSVSDSLAFKYFREFRVWNFVK